MGEPSSYSENLTISIIGLWHNRCIALDATTRNIAVAKKLTITVKVHPLLNQDGKVEFAK
jgi:hypothetical protein